MAQLTQALEHVQGLGVVGDQHHLVRGGGLDHGQEAVQDCQLPGHLRLESPPVRIVSSWKEVI